MSRPDRSPQTYEDGRRFLIPSTGPDSGGRVFTFDSEEDLEMVRNYYEGLNEAGGILCCSYIYQNGMTLLQLPGAVPESQAENYNKALQSL